MNFGSIISQLTDDEIDKAFTTFDAFFNSVNEFQDELRVIQSDFSSLKKKQRQGTIDMEDSTTKENRIREALFTIHKEMLHFIDEKTTDKSKTEKEKTNKSETVQIIVEDALEDGYEIVSELFSDESSYYFKAKSTSNYVEDDYYVVQVLNWYKLNKLSSGFNQKYLDFFLKSPPSPFLDIISFEAKSPSYIIRKYAKGIDLTNLIESGSKLSLIHALDIIIKIAEGLKGLDREGIFYNNLIPDQIILDSELKLHLLPLNIFEKEAQVVTWKNLRDGIKFMSPEQLKLASKLAEQMKLNTTSNQFSLGLILFYSLMGEALFDGQEVTSAYKDRIDEKVTNAQLEDFYNTVHMNLIQYGINEESTQKHLTEFKDIFKKLIEADFSKRHKRFDQFLLRINSLKTQVELEKFSNSADALVDVLDSFDQSINNNDKFIKEFYEALANSDIPHKKSIEPGGRRNIKFRYALNYLLNSISNFKDEKHLENALSCLVKSLHNDLTIDEYEIYFDVLKASVSKNDNYWSDNKAEAWDDFIQHSLDAIDTILQPIVIS